MYIGSNEDSKAEMEAQEENKQFISWSEINACRLTEEGIIITLGQEERVILKTV